VGPHPADVRLQGDVAHPGHDREHQASADNHPGEAKYLAKIGNVMCPKEPRDDSISKRYRLSFRAPRWSPRFSLRLCRPVTKSPPEPR